LSPSIFSALKATIFANAPSRGGESARAPGRRVDAIQFSASVASEGAIVFAHACKLGLEGIVSKRAGSAIRAGRAATG
jgi:ATP-dependent DNA ligase